MRESNFAFPAQNKACVCINAQLYDRRALDTTSPLPLLNSLQHLQFLTSTSPRIREIMTMDGGLERLVRILYDFCLSPPPPESPTLVYGLTPPTYRPSKAGPALNPTNYDKHAAFRFSQAFQCVVNIGVRGSEPIRSRVVQAGTLDVVGCILEAWLASKGFAIGPSSSATGIPRETREQRQARRLAQAEQRQREEAAALARALQRQIVFDQMQQRFQHAQERARIQRIFGEGPGVDEIMDVTPNNRRTRQTMLITDLNQNESDTDPPTDTPTSTVTPATTTRDRSGTIVASHHHTQLQRPPLPTHINPQILLSNPQPQASTSSENMNMNMQYRRNTPSPSASTDTSRAETETEDEPEHEQDADGDVDMDRSPSSERGSSPSSTQARPTRSGHRANRTTIASRRLVGQFSEARLHINANLAPRNPNVAHQDAIHQMQPLPHNLPNHQHGHHNLSGYTQGQTLSPGSVGSAASTPASGSASPSPERDAPPFHISPHGAAGQMRHPGGRLARFGGVGAPDHRHERTATLTAGTMGTMGTMPGMDMTINADPHIVISDAGGGPGVVGDNAMTMGPIGVGVGGDGVPGVVEEDGMVVSLQTNDDFAMGAPPGAPGAIVLDTGSVGLEDGVESGAETDTAETSPHPSRPGFSPLANIANIARSYLVDEGRTPRAGFVDLPDASTTSLNYHNSRESTIRGRSASMGEGSSSTLAAIASASSNSRASTAGGAGPSVGSRDDSGPVASGGGWGGQNVTNTQHGHRAMEMMATASNGSVGSTSTTGATARGASTATATATIANATTNGTAATPIATPTTSSTATIQTPGPYRDEDVLLGLQLLAYLSKYPHVRQAFYKPRPSFHPASLGLHQASASRSTGTENGLPSARDGGNNANRERQQPSAVGNQSFFRALAGRGRAALNCAGLGGGSGAGPSTAPSTTSGASSSSPATQNQIPKTRQTNVFSLVERFTFKPSSNEADLPNPPPRLPPEIQYWAGVIMRNACRKDDSRGGIRQCANMLCGRWEQYPREFAKCRRCRKAKYCGKECQSTAWSEGHRFWCSARDADEEGPDRDSADRRERGRGEQGHPHARTDEPNAIQAQAQAQGFSDDVPLSPIVTATMPGALNISPVPASPRAERAARRERERRLREFAGVEAADTTPAEPALVAASAFAGRLNLVPSVHRLMFIPPGTPSPVGEVHPHLTHQASSPVAGPSVAHSHSHVAPGLTEAAAHQQRMQEHQRILETDWFGQPQAGPSRLAGWQIGGVSPTAEVRDMEATMSISAAMADEADMILG